MTIPDIKRISDESRQAYIEDLYLEARKGNVEALEKLGLIASGRNDLPKARELIKKLEEKNG
jgi:hypothetical protein